MRLTISRFSHWSRFQLYSNWRTTTHGTWRSSPLTLIPSFPVKNDLKTIPCQFRRWESKKQPSEEEEVVAPEGTFAAKEMELNMVPDEKLQKKPEDWTKTMWKVFTDYMFSVRWNAETGWGTPSISPIGKFRIHPGSKCLQYGVEVFEGMKAYRGSDGCIRLFRPELHMKRMLEGAKRLHLPSFCPDEFIECIKKLVKMEQDWIPEGEGNSLYIRPCYIGTEACLEYTPTKSALLYVVLCPVPDTETKPISVYADSEHVKAWPGGFGDVKLGGNIGPMIQFQMLARSHDCKQILWLQGDKEEISDMGYMNVFFVMKTSSGESELVTPPLTGVQLNGVVRQSILDLCEGWKKFPVSQRRVSIHELIPLINNGKLKEMFGSGTTDIISPVTSIVYRGSKLDIRTLRQDKPIHAKITKALKDIYFGRVDHPWAVRVDE